ncbi:MAG: DMT family transporter [Pseudomonadota bacterium]
MSAPIERSQWLPSLMLVASAACWGLFWIPMREFRDAGLDAAWAGVGQFLTPFVVLVPFAIWRVTQGKPTGLASWKTAIFTGGAFVLYADSLVLTEVARALILFYVSPAWATIFEVTLMKRRLTFPRVLAIVLGLAGLYVILGSDGSIPIPHNTGDWMALLSGLFWAYGSTRIRMTPGVGMFENVFSFFMAASLIGLAITLLPIDALGRPPSMSQTIDLLPWLLLVAVAFLIPVMCMQLYAVRLVDPGRVGILFQAEAIFGIASAAILTTEPFGWIEATGTALVIAAGLVEVAVNRPRARRTTQDN